MIECTTTSPRELRRARRKCRKCRARYRPVPWSSSSPGGRGRRRVVSRCGRGGARRVRLFRSSPRRHADRLEAQDHSDSLSSGTAAGLRSRSRATSRSPIRSSARSPARVLFAVAAGYRLVRKAEGMAGRRQAHAMIGAFLGWRWCFPFSSSRRSAAPVRRVPHSPRRVGPLGDSLRVFLAPAAALVYVFGHDLWRAYTGFFLGRS